MPDWRLEYREHDWSVVRSFDPINPVVVLKHNEPCTLTCELPLSDDNLTRDLIGPKRNDFRLWRGNTAILDGELREVSLEFERDTLLCEHADYMQYLDERIYPFHYPFVVGEWPKKWATQDLWTVSSAIIDAMMDEDVYVPPYVVTGGLTGVTTNYRIDPGDGTTVLEHLRNLADREDGFDIRVPGRDGTSVGSNIPIQLLHPKADDEEIIYTITESVGQISRFNWTNKGPDQTWTLGLGSGYPAKSNAQEATHTASRQQFRRRDAVVDFGPIRNLNHLTKLTNAESSRALFPQKELELGVLVDVRDLPNFWAANMGRPRSLLGRRIWVGPINFQRYHTIDAAFKILDMTIEPDPDGNEFVTFGLEMIGG
jgi:hypothetical protein